MKEITLMTDERGGVVEVMTPPAIITIRSELLGSWNILESRNSDYLHAVAELRELLKPSAHRGVAARDLRERDSPIPQQALDNLGELLAPDLTTDVGFVYDGGYLRAIEIIPADTPSFKWLLEFDNAGGN